VKFRSVQQFAENQRYLLFHNAGAIVLHADFVSVRAGGFQVNPDLRNDSGFFAGIKGIVHGFLYGCEKRLSRIIETQEMTVLCEELADGDVSLLGGHGLGGGPPRRSLGSGTL
jgi:hypothetical protein